MTRLFSVRWPAGAREMRSLVAAVTRLSMVDAEIAMSLRFNELRRGIPGVTQHMLAAQLRDLEKSGLIVRHDYEQAPPRVEYELSEAGKALRTVGDALHDWAKVYTPDFESNKH